MLQVCRVKGPFRAQLDCYYCLSSLTMPATHASHHLLLSISSSSIIILIKI